MANPPYAPSDDNGLALWANNFTTLLTAAPATYGETAPVALTCANAYAAYQSALDLVNDPETFTPVNVAAKNYQRSLMRAAIFPVATRISARTTVLPEDKTAIGVTVRIVTRTRQSVSALPLTLTLDEITIPGVKLRTQNPLTPTSTARPEGARFAEVSYRVRNSGDTADMFVGTASATRRFVTVPTDPEWRGHRIYYKARWVGAALGGGAPNVGVWSDEVTTIAP